MVPHDGAAICGDGGCDCAAGLSDCGGRCVDLDQDPENCGECGITCGGLEQCLGGECQCAAEAERCAEVCRDLQRDPHHCGTCEGECEDHQYCDGGLCACLPGLTRCGEECVDTTTDAEHCGACGHRCAEDVAGNYCHESACQATECEALGPAMEACGSSETSCVTAAALASHPTHCGQCDESCESDEVCVQGQCQSWFLPSPCTRCPCSECGQNLCCTLPETGIAVCVLGAESCPMGV